ncbi:hypothetical protein [uncultured Thiodictyon sp.]|uniref:hypothetical protein n=1 Tax=uncultured Thiodictyon sp. TaxID=1846217 RepID=UPI0025CF7976|nr:hypothetical protein [uncultured Thiodictyon sp.]
MATQHLDRRPGHRQRPHQAPATAAPQSFAWDADSLYFSVREPWPRRIATAEIAFGQVTAAAALIVESQIPEDGVIFSDGIESDFVRFDAGARATIRVPAKYGRLAI